MKAKCVSCGQVKEVCCDYGFEIDEATGVSTHWEPYCSDCCPNGHKQIWDGKCVAGGTYERMDCEQ